MRQKIRNKPYGTSPLILFSSVDPFRNWIAVISLEEADIAAKERTL